MKPFTLLLLGIMLGITAFAQQNGQLIGTVRDRNSQELLIGVTVVVEGTNPIIGAATDIEGRFRLNNIPTGSYNIKATFVGYESFIRYNVLISSGNATILNIELEPSSTTLNEVTVSFRKAASAQAATLETPLSIQSLTSEEIKSNPGGNFDISRVIQSLPGVAGGGGTGSGFRNDIVIRGGAPNENVYYIDGIEIPVINHFSTQGSAGGPQGILNVSFIEDVTLSSSAFDARYDNALASVLQFKQREGNPDRYQGNVRLSGTELALTTEGPITPKTTFLASARRSYLEFLFSAIDLPIRPNYWDFQYKITHKLDPKTTITALGVGAIDEFKFGVPRNTTPEKEYVLRSNPFINQWNYTTGLSVKRLVQDGFVNVALSRNMFDNALDRYEDGQSENPERLVLRSRSQEIENKLRVDVNKFRNGWKWAYGGVAQYVKYNNDFFGIISREFRDEQGNLVQPAIQADFNSDINFFRYGAFGQVSKSIFNERLGLSLGIRTDMNSFTDTGLNPLETLSPRFSASYVLTEKWRVNGSVGRYYKLPIYTALGFQDLEGNFVNRDNKYIRSDHYVAGLEFLPALATRFTLEGFYKEYSNYPVSVRDGISLANQGIEFGAIGNEDVSSVGRGRAYGLEFFFQQKLTRNLFAVFSYTYVRSEFTGLDPNRYIPSVWDNRNLISALFGYKLGRGWEVGAKYRYAGGSPYTPFDMEASQRNFILRGTGVLDFNRINSERLMAFNQFDFRIDKKWNFRSSTFGLFLDIQNAFLSRGPELPRYTFQRTEDNSAFATTDGMPIRLDGANGIPFILPGGDPLVLPTIGFILEF